MNRRFCKSILLVRVCNARGLVVQAIVARRRDQQARRLLSTHTMRQRRRRSSRVFVKLINTRDCALYERAARPKTPNEPVSCRRRCRRSSRLATI